MILQTAHNCLCPKTAGVGSSTLMTRMRIKWSQKMDGWIWLYYSPLWDNYYYVMQPLYCFCFDFVNHYRVLLSVFLFIAIYFSIPCTCLLLLLLSLSKNCVNRFLLFYSFWPSVIQGLLITISVVCCALHCGRTMRTGMLWTETSLSCACLSNDSASNHDGHTLEACVIHLKWCVEAQIFSSIKLWSSEPIRRMDPTGFTLKPNKQSRHLSPVCSHEGLLLFALGMSINIHSDHILRNLRKPGETVYRIPHGTAAPGPPQTTSWETPLHFLDQSSGASVISHIILESSFFSQEECSALCLEQTSLGRLWSGAVML